MENGKEASYSFGSNDTYKRWTVDSPISAKVKIEGALKTEEKESMVNITVEPGTRVKIIIDNPEDLDKFGEYLYDKDDVSRLPRKIRDNQREKDLLSISWQEAESGKFLSQVQNLEKIWEAPGTPGQYKLSVKIEDLGIIRPPDEGERRDRFSFDLDIIAIVE